MFVHGKQADSNTTKISPGESINNGLVSFNNWFDQFILLVAKPLAILGFVLGTIDIYTRGGLAVNPFFSVAWSVAQALTIDGLFFAVWWRFFGLKWEWQNGGRIFGLLVIGLLLSVVAVLTNMVIGFQQMWGVADAQQAMLRLGVDPVTFTVTRAVLVVIVTIMVSYTYYKSHNGAVVGVNETVKTVRAVTPTVNTPSHPSHQTTVKASTPVTPPLLPSTTNREAIKQAMLNRMVNGMTVNLREIADELAIRYDTVRKHAPAIKLELTQEAEDVR